MAEDPALPPTDGVHDLFVLIELIKEATAISGSLDAASIDPDLVDIMRGVDDGITAAARGLADAEKIVGGSDEAPSDGSADVQPRHDAVRRAIASKRRQIGG